MWRTVGVEWAVRPHVWDNDRRSGAAGRHTPHRWSHPMSKRARKRRSRKGNAANHGRKPNA